MEKIGIGIITYNRPNQFKQIVDSIKIDAEIIAIKDGGKLKYPPNPTINLIELHDNKGVGFCKNLAFDYLSQKDVTHYFLIEDDCLVTDNAVWQYCIDFSHESGLLHFNWNDYRHPHFARAEFVTKMALLSHHTEANFSYFHKDFLEKIRFDPAYVNAWEHIDLEMQGEQLGFLPPFRAFVSPANLNKYLKLIDGEVSTITGTEKYYERVIEGHHYFKSKWGCSINEIELVPLNIFYEKMKEITIKYGKRS